MARVSRDHQHNYTVSSGVGAERPPSRKFKSVTTYLDVIDKSKALVPWAVRVTCDFVQRGLERLNKEEIFLADALQLVEKARKEARFTKEDAADVGTIVHKLIEAWSKKAIETGPPDYAPRSVSSDERVNNSFNAFLAWAKAHSLRPVSIETVVWSEKEEFQYAGTLDLLATVQFDGETDERYLIDFKTSNGFWETFGPQVAAYRTAYAEMNPKVTIHGHGILRLDKETGEPEFKDYSDTYQRDFQVFQLAKQLYNALHGGGR